MIHGTATEGRLTLDGRVFCANCGWQMRNTSRRYYCPHATVDSGGTCSTRPLNAQRLLRSVVIQMISRLATEETVESISQDIRNSTRENARIQRGRMEQAEAAIAEARAHSNAGPQVEENVGNSREEMTDEITAFDTAIVGLAFQAMVARNELDKIEFVSDEVGLREAIKDPETYMGANSPEDAQELLDLLVRKVTVGNGQATVHYEQTMPSGNNSQGILKDRIPLT